MLWLYRLLFLPVLAIMAPRYLLRMRKRGGYRDKFEQRFGAHDGLPAKPAGVKRVWVQAVSVGEVLAIAPLLEALIKDRGVEIYLTTTTSTGYRVAVDRYAHLAIGIGYFPIDWWLFSARAWRKVAPDLAVLTEGERWPEHIHQAVTRGVPVICINARMSDRTFRRMQRFRLARGAVLGGISRLLASSAQDERRLRELGVSAERLTNTGNLKLDVKITRLAETEKARLRRELGLAEERVLLGSSTWPGEEEALLETWAELNKAGTRCALLLVPRHAERRPEIERLVRNAGATYHLRSRGTAKEPVQVAVGDTTGELQKLTQLADLVFVGKSLPPNEGGQTPVEAAALGKPMIFGPRMSNFRTIARELVECGGAVQVADEYALRAEVKSLLDDATKRASVAAAAEKWQRANAGAVERTLAVLREELEKR